MGIKVGNLFVLMFPLIGMILHLATAAVLWFGGHRVDAGRDADRRADRVPAVPAADPHGRHDGHLHGDDDPARRRFAPGASTRCCGTEPSSSDARRGPGRARAAACVEFRDVTSATRAPRRPCSTACPSPPSRATRRRSSAPPAPARPPCSTSIPRLYDAAVRRGARRRRRRRRLTRAQIAASAWPVPQRPYLFSGTVATNLRFGTPEATDEELWDALEIAQARGLRAREARPVRRHDRPGRHQRLGRTAPAAVHRPGPGREAERLPLRRLVLRARRHDRRPAARGPAEPPRSGGHHRRPARLHHHRRRPDPRPRPTARSSARGTHEELSETSDTYREIVESQISVEEVA